MGSDLSLVLELTFVNLFFVLSCLAQPWRVSLALPKLEAPYFIDFHGRPTSISEPRWRRSGWWDRVERRSRGKGMGGKEGRGTVASMYNK